MLETIANSAREGFLATPRSMMGSWVCESPRIFIDPPKAASIDSNSKLSIEIPHLDESASKNEQRDAPDNCMRGNESSDARTIPATGSNLNGAETPRDNRFDCDYDKNPTELFLHLQRKEWDKAAKRADAFALEARTWVSRREKQGKLRWRLLPLHAAIIFKAPEKVVETLLACYPKGAQSKDDQGMLPLHLAFRHGSTEATVNLLLVAFPQSVEVKDRKGRIPLVLAQASASPNRDAFVRALERGPTYYANAAAATERAAVTAEQRAIFDAKLIEVEKKHHQDITALKEERDGLNETVELLQKELAKQKGATQVLVDHVNSLEAHLRTKGETERFLAVKAATLDTNLREVNAESGNKIQTLVMEIEALRRENVELKESQEQMQAQMEEQAAQMRAESQAHMEEQATQMQAQMQEQTALMQAQMQNQTAQAEQTRVQDTSSGDDEDIYYLKEKVQQQGKELKSLKMDWASAQARAAVLEAQLKTKIENEHELASQVSQLAGKLAKSAADNTANTNMYTQRIEMLEDERERLRATVTDLGNKLLKVSSFMNKMTHKTQESTRLKSEEARQKQREKQARLLADASNHEQLIRTALAEREHMAQLLKKQEEEMAKSARQHQEILEKLAELKKANEANDEDDDDIAFSNSLTEEMREMMNNVMMGMPVPSTDSDLVESVSQSVERPNTSSKKESKSNKVSIRKLAVDSFSDDEDEDDPQKCLEEALRALELSRTKSVCESHQMSARSAMSDGTSLVYNPSDEESNKHA